MKYANVTDARTDKELAEVGLYFESAELNTLCDCLREWKAKHKRDKRLDIVQEKANKLVIYIRDYPGASTWFFVPCKIARAIHDTIKEYCTAHPKSKNAAHLDECFESVPYCYM